MQLHPMVTQRHTKKAFFCVAKDLTKNAQFTGMNGMVFHSSCSAISNDLLGRQQRLTLWKQTKHPFLNNNVSSLALLLS